MKFDLVRAWKDESYRQSLSDEQLNQLPENPAGAIDLTDAELESVFGGNGWENNGWGSGSNFNQQRNSNICSIICSHDCDVNILDILNLGHL